MYYKLLVGLKGTFYFVCSYCCFSFSYFSLLFPPLGYRTVFFFHKSLVHFSINCGKTWMMFPLFVNVYSQQKKSGASQISQVYWHFSTFPIQGIWIGKVKMGAQKFQCLIHDYEYLAKILLASNGPKIDLHNTIKNTLCQF